MEFPSGEKEEIYFIPLIEQLEEELENPIRKPYVRSKDSTMVGEGEVHNVNDELRIGGGINIGGGGGRGGRGDLEPFGFPILYEDTTVTMKNI